MSLLHKDVRPPKNANITFYHTYHFRREEQDPIVDKMQTLMDDEVGKAKGRFQAIHEGTGLSTTTLSNWFVHRKTRRPQYASIAAFARFCGYDLALVKTSNKANGQAWKASEPRIIRK